MDHPVQGRTPSPCWGGLVAAHKRQVNLIGNVITGDIVVTDAPPVPTTKGQCKNGGWRSFGSAFQNQGQCVAFVNRGPKR